MPSRACLALKLWSIERKSHVMALVADEGLACLPASMSFPKKSFLSEYSSRIDHRKTRGCWPPGTSTSRRVDLFPGDSFNLDFHSVPYYGEHPVVERHYVSMRSRRQPSVLVFLAQDADSQAFCYSNADLRKGEEPRRSSASSLSGNGRTGQLPRHLVFDSKLTTYASLARLDQMDIPFITLRRRSPKLLKEIVLLPALGLADHRTGRAHPQVPDAASLRATVTLAGRPFRQLFIQDLGHDEPTILLTNQRHAPAKALITRYAQRMLIENTLSDAVRFFHMDALSSAVGLKVDFDMALLVVASGLYRLLARRMRGYGDAQARQIFRDWSICPPTSRSREHEVASELSPPLPSAHHPGLWAHGQPGARPLVERFALAADDVQWPDRRADFLGQTLLRGNPG